MFDSWMMQSLAGLLIAACALVSQGEPGPAAEQLRVPPGQMPPAFDQDVARVVADLDRIEAGTLQQMDRTTLDREGQIRTLGKLLLFDKNLSVNKNEACSFCHTPETGFTGPISIAESDDGCVSGLGANAFQPTQAAELHVRDLRSRTSLQRATR